MTTEDGRRVLDAMHGWDHDGVHPWLSSVEIQRHVEGMTVRKVGDELARLEREGLVEREARYAHSNSWRIL